MPQIAEYSRRCASTTATACAAARNRFDATEMIRFGVIMGRFLTGLLVSCCSISRAALRSPLDRPACANSEALFST